MEFVLCLLVLFLAASYGANESQINELRNNFIHQLINQIPFPEIKLTNNVEVLDDDTVKYYLYTNKQPYDSIPLHENASLVDSRLPVKMLVHGWTEHYYVGWCKNLTAAYLKKGRYNVIVIDWSKKGDQDYIAASNSVESVGNSVGDFIMDVLVKERKVPYKRIHLISHSLGAHVAAMTGQRVAKVSGNKLGRITALDPAAPVFEMVFKNKRDRLSADDAAFVDIVHTDSGVLGFRSIIGTVDFFPNGGGAIQPGCGLIKVDVKYEDLFCSHASSHKFFLRSVLANDMTAVQCPSWDKFSRGKCNETSIVRFGEHVPTNITGTYFLKTPEDPI